MSEARVVLVKPGDLLIIGNVGTLYEDEQGPDLTPLTTIKEALGLAGAVVFEGDIDLAAVTAPSALPPAEPAGTQSGSRS